jgi:hypothetical protein
MTFTTEASPFIGIAELQEILSVADPAALLVSPRVLRRVIKQDRGIAGIGLQVPHRKTYVIGRDALLALADREELGVSAARELPETLVLLGCPYSWLLSHTRSQALVRYWRLLFHARIDHRLGQQIAASRLSDAALRERIQRVGQTEFDEACQVLRQENFLLPPANLHTCFTEFTALFLELRYFARPLLGRYFPSIDDPERVEALLAEPVDAEALYHSTRLASAPDPVLSRAHEEAVAHERVEAGPSVAGRLSPLRCLRLMARADKVAARGNVVRAALLRTRASRVAPPEMLEATRKGALADLDRLVTRLQTALELHDREAEEWRSTLPALLGPAARGLWPPSARLLYDLQKVCVDYERDIYSVDLVEWVVSMFRQPIKRQVPLQADVLLVKHLRSAAGRLSRARIGDDDRRRLAILLRSATHHCEERLREKLRPRLTDALEAVGFRPANYPEEVARRKMVEEMLDRVTERGFLTMGDLRDAVARNQLKLPDLDGPRTLLLGDQLIRLNRQLAIDLDGVYKRGEFYLRWLQRLSSLFFGTYVGRLLTVYLLVPFGGALATLIFAQELLHLVGIKIHVGHAGAEGHAGHGLMISPAAAWSTVGILGVFYLLLIHWPLFRARVAKGLKVAWKGLRGALFDAPAAVVRHPSVRRVLESQPVVQFRRFVLRPLVTAGLAAIPCLLLGARWQVTAAVSGGTFLLALAFFGSRLGRRMEEEATDWTARNWYWVRVGLLPGLINLILFVFKEALDRLERVIYTVDEWLRFRSGESKWSLVYKPVLGLVWFLLTYVIRVLINVFIEPTVNPVKHFPAVTVTGKAIAPLCLPAVMKSGVLTGGAIAVSLAPIYGLTAANVIAGVVLTLLPGLGGFLIWELKENWKQYRSNRSPVLKPVMIGHHGETMLRFMRPGFHSGTLPKLYAKLRKAERRDNGRALHKHQETLHHVKESIRHFLEREFVMLLEGSKGWGSPRLHVGAMLAGCNRVRVEVCCPELSEQGLWLSFEEHAGWLVGEVTQPGWLEKLTQVQTVTLVSALAGLYKLAGVSLVSEQVRAVLPAAHAWRVARQGLIYWPGDDFSKEMVVDLCPEDRDGAPAPPVPPERLLYSSVPVAWDDWVAAWTRDQEGQPADLPVLKQARLLPEPVPVS